MNRWRLHYYTLLPTIPCPEEVTDTIQVPSGYFKKAKAYMSRAEQDEVLARRGIIQQLTPEYVLLANLFPKRSQELKFELFTGEKDAPKGVVLANPDHPFRVIGPNNEIFGEIIDGKGSATKKDLEQIAFWGRRLCMINPRGQIYIR